MSPRHSQSGSLFAAVIASTLLFSLAVGSASARHGGRDGNRERHYGIIKSMPQGGRIGTWVIGGRSVTADRSTEFDETEGRLAIGRCAKIDLRNGRVHEIDSEPASDCR